MGKSKRKPNKVVNKLVGAFNSLKPVADFFGFGDTHNTLVNSMYKWAGNKQLSTADLQKAIDQLTSSARAKGSDALKALQDSINKIDYSSLKSNLTRDAMAQEVKKMKKVSDKASSMMDLAENALTDAKSTAGNLDYLPDHEKYMKKNFIGQKTTAGHITSNATNAAKRSAGYFNEVDKIIKENN